MFPEQYETDITGRTGREATLSGFNEDCAAIRVRVLYSSRIPRRKAGDFLCDTACRPTDIERLCREMGVSEDHNLHYD